MTTLDLDAVLNQPRLRLEAALAPAQGARFQPTGFPDLGAATFRRPETGSHAEMRMVVVESAQSIANRLEAVCWDTLQNDLVPELRGMPYVRVELTDGPDGVQVTSSLQEAHRLNSPYILKQAKRDVKAGTPLFAEEFRQQAGIPAKGKKAGRGKSADSAESQEEEGAAGIGVLNMRRIAATIFHYDPNSVLHGVFLANLDGRVRLTRAVSGFIEAENVRDAVSGGVKLDRVHAGGDTAEGYGNVPYARTEYTAERITAYFSLDLALLRGYGLSAAALRFLGTLALWKIRRFLASGLRLRTACDFEVQGELVARVDGQVWGLPEEPALCPALEEAIAACQKESGLFAQPAITVLTRPLA